MLLPKGYSQSPPTPPGKFYNKFFSLPAAHPNENVPKKQTPFAK